MTKIATIAVCATLLWASVGLATPTAQQSCDYARITAWKKYTACIENVVAKDAKGVIFDEFAAFARCRHTYFRKWAGFQNPRRKPSLLGSTCIGDRFTDNGDQTVTDNLSGLVWEQKDASGGVHDANGDYTWSTGTSLEENGTAFADFLGTLNSNAGFAGSSGWRLPTLGELQTIVLDFTCRGPGFGETCSCASAPCIQAALGLTVSSDYWTATTYVPDRRSAWYVYFYDAGVFSYNKTSSNLTRAVRGGF